MQIDVLRRVFVLPLIVGCGSGAVGAGASTGSTTPSTTPGAPPAAGVWSGGCDVIDRDTGYSGYTAGTYLDHPGYDITFELTEIVPPDADPGEYYVTGPATLAERGYDPVSAEAYGYRYDTGDIDFGFHGDELFDVYVFDGTLQGDAITGVLRVAGVTYRSYGYAFACTFTR